jgi:hypothetical protein
MINQGAVYVTVKTFIDYELIKAIINRVIAVTLRDKLGLNNVNYDAKRIEWCPVWTMDPKTKEKKLLRFKVRVTGMKEFKDLYMHEISTTGLQGPEVLEYLKKSDAVRVKITD